MLKVRIFLFIYLSHERYEVLQTFVSTNSAEKHVFLKHDCNLQHLGTTGGESFQLIRTPHVTEWRVVLLSGRSVLHFITREGRIPERGCSLPAIQACCLGNLNTAIIPFLRRGAPGAPVILDSTMTFPSPLPICRGVQPGSSQVALDRLFLARLQAITTFCSFPFRPVKPAHWPCGFSAAYLPLLSGSNKASRTLLPTMEEHLSV